MIRLSRFLRLASVIVPGALAAQSPITLTLGGAARLAAAQSGASLVARTRVQQADARVRQTRALLFPTLSASAGESERNQNTATFGFSFKDPTGKPIFDPNGQTIPPFKVLDVRGRAQADLVDWSVVKKIGAIARPDDILFTADLPKTRSGKIMRRLLRDIAEGWRRWAAAARAHREAVPRRSPASPGDGRTF